MPPSDAKEDRSAVDPKVALRRVLLVDADDCGRDVTRGLLNLALRGSVDISETGDLEEAIDLIAAQGGSGGGAMFDCIMLACDVAGIDAPGATGALRRMAEVCGGQLPCPTIVLDGGDGSARAEAVFEAGAQDCLAKQWLTPRLLRRVLENAIARFAVERRSREQTAALEAANERVRRASDAAGLGYWRFDPLTNAADVDAACAALFGRSREAMAPAGAAFDAIHPDDRHAVAMALQKTADGEGRYACEFRALHPDGSTHWLAGLGNAIRDEEGALIAFIGVSWDVTQRHRDDERVRLALASAEVGTWEVDPAAGRIVWDDRCAAIMGLPTDGSLSLEEAFALMHEEDRPAVEAAAVRAMDPATAGDYDIEYRITRGDRFGWVHAVGRCVFREEPSSEHGQVADRFFGVIYDVTERRLQDARRHEAERQRELALQSAQLGTWVVDVASDAVSWDARCSALFGFDNGQSVTMADAVARIHPDDRADVERAIAAAFDPGTGGEYDGEYRVQVPGRDVAWLRVVGRVTFRDDPSAEHGRVPERFFGVIGDVSERRHADQALRESESRLRDLFTSIDEGYCLCEMLLDDVGRPTDYRFLEANPLFAEWTGIERPVGRTAYSAVPELERHWLDTYARAALGGETLRFEQWAEPMGRWFDVYAAPARAERQFAIVFKDVTERKRAEGQLRAGEERLAVGAEVAGLGLIEVDYASDRCRLDARAAALFGLGESEFELARGDVHGTFHPDDRLELLRHVDACVDPTGDGTFAMDHRIVSPADGSVRWLRVRKQVFFEGNGEARTPARAMLAALDVTAERQAEESLRRNERELRTLAVNTPDIVARFDRDLRHVFVNEAVRKATGLPPEAFLGKTNQDMSMPAEIREQWDAKLRAVFETGEPESCDFSFAAPDGEREYEARLIPEKGDNGEIVTVLSVTRDITHARRMQRQMQASYAEAERANSAKDHFLAVLSHELRTPLTPVLAAAGALANREDLPADVREDLAMIRRNVELEGRLMDDLLDLTRISRGKLELNFATVDVHESIDRVLEMVTAEAGGKQVTITTDLQAAQRHVSGDGARMQQILWNLLKNAVKFTPSGGTVSVTTINLSGSAGDPAGRLRIVVHDTGVGIAADVLHKVFDAFEQGGSAVTRQFGGMGLGLAITKVLVYLHGGTITAQSPGRGEGATFVIEFPAVPAAEPAAVERPGPAEGRTLRVLLVEDHADTAKMMARLLRARGLDVKWADTVAAGLRTLNADRFDVLVSDLGLPDGSGHDLLRQARAAGSIVPAIVLSGFGSDKDRQQSAAAGFMEHLTKPIDFDQLVTTVRRAAAASADAAP